MNADSWSCLMVGRGMRIVNEQLRNILKASACNMHLQKLDRMVIKNDLCDGVMQTEWTSYTVGARSGVLFRSQIECEGGECQINFLLSTKDLEAGASVIRDMEEYADGTWEENFEDFPIPELYQFHDLRRHRMN
jgi:hypothetical protein